MKEEFINDLRIYSETVESVEGLEVIKECILEYVLNLETISDDYVNIENISTHNGVVSEAKKLIKILTELVASYEIIKDYNLRDLYKLINNFHYWQIKEMFSYVCEESKMKLVRKNKMNIGDFEEYGLSEHMLEDWYKELYMLIDKYDI